MPDYGRDTVYRLSIPDIGDVAVVQKGCPDGKHSSVAWSVPDWAVETYLWWLCPSLKNHPGWHVSAGVKRLRGEFFSSKSRRAGRCDLSQQTHAGRTSVRVRRCATSLASAAWMCPRLASGHCPSGPMVPTTIGTVLRTLRFPAILLSAFGLESSHIPLLHRLRRLQGVSIRRPNHDHVPVRAGQDHHVQEFLMPNPVLDQERVQYLIARQSVLV